MRVEAKLAEMGLALPAEMRVPEGFRVTWRQVRVVGTRGTIAGHGPRQADGTFFGPGVKVGRDLTVELQLGLSLLAGCSQHPLCDRATGGVGPSSRRSAFLGVASRCVRALQSEEGGPAVNRRRALTPFGVQS
jgi:hypothetical protein